MFTKGQSSELAWVTSSNIPSPLYLISKVLPPVYKGDLTLEEAVQMSWQAEARKQSRELIRGEHKGTSVDFVKG